MTTKMTEPTPTAADRALARQQTNDTLDAGIERMRRFLDAGEGDATDARRLMAYLEERERRIARSQLVTDIVHDFETACDFGNSEAAQEAARVAVIMGVAIEVGDQLNAVRVRRFKTHTRFVLAQGEAGGRRGLRG